VGPQTVRAFDASDDDEFEVFFQRALPGALRLAHLLTGSVSIGQDVAQDAMAAVHKQWIDIENPAAYLRTVVVNLSRSAQRRSIRERLHLHGRAHTVTTIPEIDETWHLLRQLPAAQRAVVVLRFYEDLSLAEIAEHLGKPIGTVKSTLHRALANMKEALK
jgi:RNA polymerase sigma factor (sigma-70 family)